MGASANSNSSQRRRRRPAATPEARENQLISLAVDLAEKQLADGTASAQVVTHYLKMATGREVLERERLKHEIELSKAKVESYASAQRMEELYTKAMSAFSEYRGETPAEGDE